MKNLSVNLRLFLLVALLSSVSILVGLMGLRGMSESVAGLRTVYEDRVVPLRDLKVIADLYAVNIGLHVGLTEFFAQELQYDHLLLKTDL